MKGKIFLDAGHGGTDTGLVYHERREKDNVLKIVLALATLLTEEGFEVICSRVDDSFIHEQSKHEKMLDERVDCVIAFHQNCALLSDTAEGARAIVWNKEGLSLFLAKKLLEGMKKIGFFILGIFEDKYNDELKRNKIPRVVLELGYLNSEKDYFLFDQFFDQIVQELFHAICSYWEEQKNEIMKHLYRIQVGSYYSRDRVLEKSEELHRRGFPAYYFLEKGFYTLQVGSFEQLKTAVEMEKQLRNYGYTTFIT
ncbi:hypothetical protein FACS189418_4680 [Clostridia bacterium]|nr:hypothetical protein FACS189418_4680 [Clostridia bacterium]